MTTTALQWWETPPEPGKMISARPATSADIRTEIIIGPGCRSPAGSAARSGLQIFSSRTN
ncbi:hypothetical protein ABZ345_42710 [Lentzea sp. NPDC005914]|uniref:hypothetical protein n=1 Tax=Lentzea sp. NPDC005914 TaxID=3154572 RepID=UPI0033EA5416